MPILERAAATERPNRRDFPLLTTFIIQVNPTAKEN